MLTSHPLRLTTPLPVVPVKVCVPSVRVAPAGMPPIEVMVWVSEPSVSTDVTFKPNAMLLFSAT
ncbi:hypothetical protein D3C81_1346270 [compost metagenome]